MKTKTILYTRYQGKFKNPNTSRAYYRYLKAIADNPGLTVREILEKQLISVSRSWTYDYLNKFQNRGLVEFKLRDNVRTWQITAQGIELLTEAEFFG